MNVTIIETNKEETLSIIDPKSGADWTNDLIGNHGALPEYHEDTDSYHMTQECYEWWADLIERYQAADDRYNELLHGLTEEEAEALRDAAHSISCDLENYPEVLQAVCNDAEGGE